MSSADAAAQNGSSGANGSSGMSAAQRLMQKTQDESHRPTIEDVPDEEDLTPHPHPISSSVLESTDEPAVASSWAPSISAKAAGKRKEEPSAGKANTPLLDTQSDELFPGLGGAPKPVKTTPSPWVSKRGPPATNGARNGTSTNGSSTPISDTSIPASQTVSKDKTRSSAGEVGGLTFSFPSKDLPRSATKKPLPEIIKEINKKHRLNLTQTTGEGGIIKITAGPATADSARKRQAFKELGLQINTKTSQTVPIPRSARAQVIGKGGATIKGLQEQSGARIQMPKMEDTPESVEDDDDLVNVVVEGNPIAVKLAKADLEDILRKQSSNVNIKLRTIPAEFYPFISGKHNENVDSLGKTHNVQIRVPPHHTWTFQPPPQPSKTPTFTPAAGENHITLGGDRAAVQAARAEIEAHVEQLRRQLIVEQVSLNKGTHQFIIGEKGESVQDFFAATNCAIILPTDEEDENITIVGLADDTEAAMGRATENAMSMKSSSIDIARQLGKVPGAHEHARNITQYLHDRQEIKRLEKEYQAAIFTPDGDGQAAPWTLYSREARNAVKAQSEIKNLVMAHPPSRMAAIPIDSFFHNHLKRDIRPRVKQDYGVHVVIPDKSETVLLVFEGAEGMEPQYTIPQSQPSAAEIQAFQQGLADARKHILDIIDAQAEIISRSIDVPFIFHKKLQKFILNEQKNRPADQIPVRVFPKDTVITLRGPAPAVESLEAKVRAFVDQAIEDEKERGFTLSFDFPKEYAGQLVGRGASKINELRDQFDVEIKVDDGKVELKGPKAKAEAAKSHITSLGRQWADIATYTLKVDPEYHSELIGSKGSVINKLQTRYKVQIHFPRQNSTRDDQSNVDTASDAGRRGNRPEQLPDQVIVKGPKKGADEARDEILSLLQYFKDNSHEATVTVKAGQIPQLIGQRGSGMDEIRQSTGAKIDVPNNAKGLSPEEEVVIKIKGTKSEMSQAKKLIEEKRDIYDQTIKKSVSVDKKYHRMLIGSGGATIRDIVVKAGGSDNSRESARTVQFPKSEADGNEIRIEGKQELVDNIIATINHMVSVLESQQTDEIDVPSEKHRSLIGRGGETKKDLESNFKVTLDIPRQGSGQTGVKITGQPADVAKARAHIEDLVKEQQGETIQVPRKVHHSVADNGAFFRRLRSDHKVTVDHAGHKIPPKPIAPANVRANGGSMPLITDDAADTADVHSWKTVDMSESELDGDIPWILRGPPDNVARAQAAVQAALEQALQNSTVGYLTLPDPSTYRYVIGQGGRKVDSIRKATGCKITVPRDQARDEAIEIVGSADGVDAARDLILTAVKEGGNANGNRS